MSQRPQPRHTDHQHAIAGFIDRYGWRAYALPVLALLTVIGLFRAGGMHNRAEAVGRDNVNRGVSHTVSQPTTSHTVSPTAGHTVSQPTTSASPAPTPAAVKRVALAPDPGKASKRTVAKTHVTAASTPCQSNTSARKVVVSIADQHAWMCAGKTLVHSSAVTTGKSGGHATPTGTFTVQGNVTNTTLRGSDYAVHVDYWIQFNGDIGFHDASWQTMAFGSPGYTTDGSRGCVHLPLTTVAWLHKWVQVGQTVVVVTKS